MRRSENIAFRLHRGRSAEDPRKTPSEVRGRRAPGGHPVVDFPFRGRRAPGEVIDFPFYLHRGRSAEDPRKTPAEDPRGRPMRKTPRKTTPESHHREL